MSTGSPISGVVKYTKYHPGNYLVAWHPKSSELNERFTSVIECPQSEFEIMVRQIAGKVARKITNYLDEGEETIQGGEFGFIKFGSRVDVFLPLNAIIQVNMKQKVKGSKRFWLFYPMKMTMIQMPDSSNTQGSLLSVMLNLYYLLKTTENFKN